MVNQFKSGSRFLMYLCLSEITDVSALVVRLLGVEHGEVCHNTPLLSNLKGLLRNYSQ